MLLLPLHNTPAPSTWTASITAAEAVTAAMDIQHAASNMVVSLSIQYMGRLASQCLLPTRITLIQFSAWRPTCKAVDCCCFASTVRAQQTEQLTLLYTQPGPLDSPEVANMTTLLLLLAVTMLLISSLSSSQRQASIHRHTSRLQVQSSTCLEHLSQIIQLCRVVSVAARWRSHGGRPASTWIIQHTQIMEGTDEHIP